MHQLPLIPQDIYEAVEACVVALGGRQTVGHMIWPDLDDPVEAGKKLGRCLNQSHAEKLSVDQLIFIMKQARQVNCHVAMDYISNKCNYKYEPVEPEDERAKLQREHIAAINLLSEITKKMEGLKGE